MSFEALTGRLPFEGDAMNVLLKKRVEAPPRASSCAREVPPDLDDLCAALLARDPALRPDAARVLEVLLGHTSTTIPPNAPPPVLLGEGPFVGRAQELLALHRSFMTMLERGASAVVIEGDSGMGKSALMRRFGEQRADGAGTARA